MVMVVFGSVSDARLSQEIAAMAEGELNATSRIAAMAPGPDKQIFFLANKGFHYMPSRNLHVGEDFALRIYGKLT